MTDMGSHFKKSSSLLAVILSPQAAEPPSETCLSGSYTSLIQRGAALSPDGDPPIVLIETEKRTIIVREIDGIVISASQKTEQGSFNWFFRSVFCCWLLVISGVTALFIGGNYWEEQLQCSPHNCLIFCICRYKGNDDSSLSVFSMNFCYIPLYFGWNFTGKLYITLPYHRLTGSKESAKRYSYPILRRRREGFVIKWCVLHEDLAWLSVRKHCR